MATMANADMTQCKKQWQSDTKCYEKKRLLIPKIAYISRIFRSEKKMSAFKKYLNLMPSGTLEQ